MIVTLQGRAVHEPAGPYGISNYPPPRVDPTGFEGSHWPTPSADRPHLLTVGPGDKAVLGSFTRHGTTLFMRRYGATPLVEQPGLTGPAVACVYNSPGASCLQGASFTLKWQADSLHYPSDCHKGEWILLADQCPYRLAPGDPS